MQLGEFELICSYTPTETEAPDESTTCGQNFVEADKKGKNQLKH